MSAARSRPLTADTPEQLEQKVRERVLRMLTAQPRTRAELERSLSRAGVPDEVISRVLDRFSELKLIDDAAYAQAYVRTGVAVRRRGTRSLTLELRGRGVAPEHIASATAQVDEGQEYATAQALASRRVAGMARLDPQVRRRRLTGLLLRRGFAAATVNAVVAEVLAAGQTAGEAADEWADDVAGMSAEPAIDDGVEGVADGV